MLVDLVLKSYERNDTYPFSYRASSSGRCARQLAYQKLGYKGEPFPARTLMVFELGHTIEAQLVKCLGDNVHSHQKEAHNDLGFCVVKGHIDFIYKDYVVDVKSTNSANFNWSIKEKGIVDHSYVCQLHCYMNGLGLKKAIVLYYNKDTSAMCELFIEWDDNVWSEVVERFNKVYIATKNDLPSREFFTVNKDNTLGYPCSYCGYKKECTNGLVESNYKLKKPKHKVPENIKELLGVI